MKAAEKSTIRGPAFEVEILSALPRAGPAACLSHQVLVSQNESPKRTRPRSLSARSHAPSRQQFVLPVLSPRRGGDGRGLAALIHSARGNREKDQPTRAPQREGLLRSLLREKQAPPAPLSKDDGERALQELSEKKGAISGHSVPSARRKVAKDTFSPEEAELRRARLENCFRNAAGAIKEAFLEAYQWHVLPELTALDAAILPQAVALKRLWEDAAVPSEIRPSAVAGTDERAPGGLDEDASAAHRAEISAAFSYVSFVRWLCGLSPVRFSASKQLACSVAAEALLPRVVATVKHQRRRSSVAAVPPLEAEAAAKPKLKKLRSGVPAPASPAVQLAEALADMAKKGAVSVLQGEGSLVSAVEQCLSAFRSAGEEEGSASAELSPASPRLSPPRPSKAPGKVPDLPAPLRQFQVLWELEAAESVEDVMPPAVSPLRRGRGRENRENRAPKSEIEASFGVDAVWGDRRGALAQRRCLLSPLLQSFAAARCDDVCVFWTGRAGCEEAFEEVAGVDPAPETPTLDAVSYPPSGLVPMALVEGQSVPWTIMPDAARFQPTPATRVRAWRVRYERHDDLPVAAERLEEVRVSNMVVDCSNQGQAFCVIFWPEIQLRPGMQIEVVLSGLCGDREEITNFHELISFRRQAENEALVAEAAKVRQLFRESQALWEVESSQDRWDIEPRAEDLAAIQPISHPIKEIVASSNDLMITLRSAASALWPVLTAQRFDGEFTEVLRACQTFRLGHQIFLVHVKLPLPHTCYELRFSASKGDAPRTLEQQKFWYVIHTTAQCTHLVRSIDDRMMGKYGFPKLEIESQLSGVTVLAPYSYRVLVGRVYFLVFVDRQVALAAAKAALPEEHAASEEASGPSLFSQRLLAEEPESPREVRRMHQILRDGLVGQTQVSSGDFHLDLMLHNGQHIHRLRERQEFPGLFESLLTVSDLDASTKIRMVLRFPRIHACDFSPRTMAEWLVSRT